MFGGSFNPVHIGHLLLADQVVRHFGLETLYFVPAAQPAHKKLDSGASEKDRLSMLRLATRDNPYFAVLDWEIERQGVSYTVDTLKRLKTDLCPGPEDRPGLLIGADLTAGFGSWREPDTISEIADIIVSKREGDVIAGFAWPHSSIDNISFKVSSSLIRERIRAQQSYRYFLSPEVYAYVQNHRLYL